MEIDKLNLILTLQTVLMTWAIRWYTECHIQLIDNIKISCKSTTWLEEYTIKYINICNRAHLHIIKCIKEFIIKHRRKHLKHKLIVMLFSL